MIARQKITTRSSPRQNFTPGHWRSLPLPLGGQSLGLALALLRLQADSRRGHGRGRSISRSSRAAAGAESIKGQYQRWRSEEVPSGAASGHRRGLCALGQAPKPKCRYVFGLSCSTRGVAGRRGRGVVEVSRAVIVSAGLWNSNALDREGSRRRSQSSSCSDGVSGRGYAARHGAQRG